ncbi:hypothetical protein [Mannheimia haemolytica]|uniref:hypothetical protein n=1 Tax=Mannheimia haemolytica TaxID=75985 RepID=UPI0031F561DD
MFSLLRDALTFAAMFTGILFPAIIHKYDLSLGTQIQLLSFVPALCCAIFLLSENINVILTDFRIYLLWFA